VVIAGNRNEAIKAVKELVSGETIDPAAAKKIVLEECLVGKEISLIMFADGKNFSLMPPTRDHKRIGEGDTGPNTGGMGTITDSGLLTRREQNLIIEQIIKPTLEGCDKEGFPFRGILFLGLMMTENGPHVLEYNVRFGDPETEAILVNLETDLVEICRSIEDQTLDKLTIEWKEGCSACIILAAENYPQAPRKGDLIEGLEEAEKHENVVIFHCGTAFNSDGDFETAGGRVLAVTSIASNLSNALHRAYKAVNEINWKGMQYRRDIGKN
jgi:phosphoribosylamine--glycine ligase